MVFTGGTFGGVMCGSLHEVCGEEDARWMRMALELARKGAGRTSPNPAVGAVIVKEGRLIAKGWHRGAGLPHAEIEALCALPEAGLAKGATLYVTLEPCSTQGRTPPCTQAIIENKFARVVYGTEDPNPKHRGRAKGLLEEAGIRVTSGILEKECSELNRRWNHYIRTGRPWVILKAAMTLDGRIGRPVPPDGAVPRQWITSEAARADAMRLRGEVDAILIGAGTMRADNPRLTVRGRVARGKRQPWRVVWTRAPEKLPRQGHLFEDAHRERTLVVDSPSFVRLLEELGSREITSVLIEGGSQVFGAAVDEGVVNEVVIYLAPVLFGGGLGAVGGLGVGSWKEGLCLEVIGIRRIGRGGEVRFQGLVRRGEEGA